MEIISFLHNYSSGGEAKMNFPGRERWVASAKTGREFIPESCPVLHWDRSTLE